MPAIVDMAQLAAAFAEQTAKDFFNEREARDRHNRGETDNRRVQRELVRNTSLIFEGGAASLVVDGWISDIDHQFKFLGVSNTYLMAKVAPIRFQKEAVAWWKGQKALIGNAVLDG